MSPEGVGGLWDPHPVCLQAGESALWVRQVTEDRRTPCQTSHPWSLVSAPASLGSLGGRRAPWAKLSRPLFILSDSFRSRGPQARRRSRPPPPASPQASWRPFPELQVGFSEETQRSGSGRRDFRWPLRHARPDAGTGSAQRCSAGPSDPGSRTACTPGKGSGELARPAFKDSPNPQADFLLREMQGALIPVLGRPQGCPGHRYTVLLLSTLVPPHKGSGTNQMGEHEPQDLSHHCLQHPAASQGGVHSPERHRKCSQVTQRPKTAAPGWGIREPATLGSPGMRSGGGLPGSGARQLCHNLHIFYLQVLGFRHDPTTVVCLCNL